MGPYIILLQQEVLVIDEWHNNDSQGIIMLSHQLNTHVINVHNIFLPALQASHHLGPLDPQNWHQQTAHPHHAANCPEQCNLRFIHARRHQMSAFAYWSRLRWWTVVYSRSWFKISFIICAGVSATSAQLTPLNSKFKRKKNKSQQPRDKNTGWNNIDSIQLLSLSLRAQISRQLV